MTEALGAPLTLIIGPEELLVDRAIATFIAATRDAGEEVDVREVAARELAPGDLAGIVTPSLFEERSVVVVRDLQDAPEFLGAELLAFAGNPADTCRIVLVHPGSAKGKRLLEALRKGAAKGLAEVACREIKGRRDKLRFLQQELRDHRRKAGDDALDLVLDAVGGDLRTLASAAGQLASDTTGLIDRETVQRYYSGRAEVSGFTVADRTLEGRTAEALEQLRWSLQAGNDPVPLLAALASGLRSLVAVGSAPRGLSAADLARHAGMPPWKVDSVRRQLRGWSEAGIARSMSALAVADADIKGAAADPVYALERAVVVISQARGN